MSQNHHVKDELKEILQGTRCYPFLFIGSGLSMRYAHTRNWSGLLKWLCDSTLGEFAYARFYNEANTAVQREEADSLFPYLATLAEDPINNVLLQDERFESFRKIYGKQINDGLSPLKLYIADDFSEISLDDNEETALLRGCSAKLSGVITTNYDYLCESLFPEFDVYIGEHELLMKDPSFSAEIFKIHGSASRPESMILTQSDYNALRSKQQYLAAKLLTLFLEYPIIFLGYSLQDEDINELLASIASCLGNNGLKQLSQRIVFVTYDKASLPSIGKVTKMFGTDALEMTQIITKDFSQIFEAIKEMDRLYDPKLVRQLRKSIVSIASHIDPSSEVVTSGFSQLGNLNDDDRVVIAFSAVNEGFGKMPTAETLYYDAVFDDKEFNPELVVSEYLPRLIKSNPGGLPIFKYLASSSKASEDARVLDEVDKRKCIDDYLNDGIRQSSSGWRNQLGTYDMQGLIDVFGFDRAHTRISCLHEDEIDATQLANHLIKLISRNGGEDFIKGNSELKRAIRIYDLLRYRSSVHGNEKPPHLSPKCEHPATSEGVNHDA